MDTAEIQRLLNEGIAAVRGGDRAAGRDLLLKVVEADDHIEPAWLWLSAALDDPHDKLVALENALTLNPGNAHAQKEAERLRQTLGIAPPAPAPAPPPKPAPPAPEPVAPPSIDTDDDPLQCPYCGRLTSDVETTCPHCRRSLLIAGQWQSGCYNNVLVMTLALATQLALLQALGPVVSVGLNQGIEPGGLVAVSRLPGVAGFFGEFLTWNALEANLLLVAVVVRFILIGGSLLLFLNNFSFAFQAAAVAPVVDLLINGAGFAFGYGGIAALGINAAMDLAIALPAWIVLMSQGQARVRQRVILDNDVHGAVDFSRRGLHYARRGKWALAALHFRRAMVLDPHVPQYFKDLARAQAQLGRYSKALSTLKEGARRTPADTEFGALIAAVEKKM